MAGLGLGEADALAHRGEHERAHGATASGEQLTGDVLGGSGHSRVLRIVLQRQIVRPNGGLSWRMPAPTGAYVVAIRARTSASCDDERRNRNCLAYVR